MGDIYQNKDSDADLLVYLFQCAYKRQVVVRMADSTQHVFITGQGQGEDPHLELWTSVLELGPCLPASTEVEPEVTARNPCSFPTEFYSLEFTHTVPPGRRGNSSVSEIVFQVYLTM